MVRARKNIKRSSGRKKVSRRKVVNPFAKGFTHEPVAKAWDRKKTVRENYAEMQLDGDPNAHTAIAASAAAASGPEPLFVDLEAIKDKLHTPGRKSVNHVGSEEAEYLDRLASRYGREFQAMAKDTQLNFNQFTATRLQKRLDRLARYRAELKEQAAEQAAAAAQEAEEESDSEVEA